MLEFGDTIEEVQQGLIESYLYSGDRDYMEKDLFAARKPNVASQFHTVNRREYYKITVNRDQVRRAFLDESGLQQYLQQILAVPTTSDQWDEFLQTTSLFAEYEANGGFSNSRVKNSSVSPSSTTTFRVVLRLSPHISPSNTSLAS